MDTLNEEDKILLMRPFMPPMQDLFPYLERIWLSRQLTNGGSIHAEFEQALCDYLGVKNISLFANGTLALIIALKFLGLEGEVITSPFTSPATAQAIYWNGLTPVFADINQMDLNLNVSAVEAAITPRTSAVLPVHIFGTPCNLEGFDDLAKKYKLKVIYDAAHSFGVKQNNVSVCNSGDLSVLSFHATKVFNTFEGGAIVCHDKATKRQIEALKNTGIGSDHMLKGYGLNAKMNEFQAAVGLCQLNYVEKVIADRKIRSLQYKELLYPVKGIRLLDEVEGVSYNYSYFPIIIHPENFGGNRNELYSFLQQSNISSRKYFFPLLTDFPEFKKFKTMKIPVAQSVAENILCLPLYHDITQQQISFIAEKIKAFQKQGS